VTVTLDRNVATLVSAGRGEKALRSIWRTSLLNERLLAEGAGKRGAVLAELVR